MIVQELIALLGVKTDPSSFKQADSALSGLASKAKAAAELFAGWKGIEWVKGIFEETTRLADMFSRVSERTGIAAESFQRLAYAANMSDVDVGTLEFTLRRLQVSLASAGKGKGDLSRVFSRLGLSAKNADGSLKSVEQVLPEIADRVVRMKTDTERAAFVTEIFGRSGTRLLPILKKGAAGIRELTDEAETLGGVMSEETVAAFAEFEDGQKRLSFVFRGLKTTIASALLPAFADLQQRFTAWMKTNRAWINLKLTAIFSKIGQVVNSVATFVARLGSAFIATFSNLSEFQSKLLKIGVIVAALAAILLLPGGSLIVLGLLVAALIDDFETWRRGGKSLTGDLIAAFKELIGIDIAAWVEKGYRVFKTLILGMLDPITKLVDMMRLVYDMFEIGPKAAWQKMEAKWNVQAAEISDLFSSKPGLAEQFGNAPSFFTAPAENRILRQAMEAPSFFSSVGVPRVGGGAGGGAVYSPTNNVTVNVASQPGMDEKKLTDEVQKKISEALDNAHRKALQALVPQAPVLPGM